MLAIYLIDIDITFQQSKMAWIFELRRKNNRSTYCTVKKKTEEKKIDKKNRSLID